MKKSNLIIAIALFVVGSMFTSCSSGKSCKKGGWYGDRNLSSVTPAVETHQHAVEFYDESTCED